MELAPCGIDYRDCGIRKAACDPLEGEREAERWRKRGHEDASAEWFKCQGCHGPTEFVWSSKCTIRPCAKERGLSNCSQCSDFPCEQILAFEGDGSPHHCRAVGRLRELAADGQQ